MSKETKRIMRLMVFFDLPMVTKEQRREYTKFRNFLLKDGYNIVQFSIYSRIIYGADSAEKHEKRVEAHVPPVGSVKSLLVTEKQYAGMNILVGKPTKQDKKVNADQLILL